MRSSPLLTGCAILSKIFPRKEYEPNSRSRSGGRTTGGVTGRSRYLSAKRGGKNCSSLAERHGGSAPSVAPTGAFFAAQCTSTPAARARNITGTDPRPSVLHARKGIWPEDSARCFPALSDARKGSPKKGPDYSALPRKQSSWRLNAQVWYATEDGLAD